MVPSSQVLVFDERLGHSHWLDHQSRARTLKGLIRELRAGVASGDYVGYRLIHIYWERLGKVSAPTVDELREPPVIK